MEKSAHTAEPAFSRSAFRVRLGLPTTPQHPAKLQQPPIIKGHLIPQPHPLPKGPCEQGQSYCAYRKNRLVT